MAFVTSLSIISRRRDVTRLRATFQMNSSNAETQNIGAMRTALSSIRTRIATAAKKGILQDEAMVAATTTPIKDVTLIAVSKTKPIELVKTCWDAGQVDFGENYVQELKNKAVSLPSDIRWHFIGALQTNKASTLLEVPNLVAVHSVDREKLARALQRAAEKVNRTKLDVMVQVNVDDEVSKAGCALGDVDQVVDAVRECDRLRFAGLMCIGRPGNVNAFDILRKERDRIALRLNIAPYSLELSMGMSADFESAIANGSTFVRVGSLLFGARSYNAERGK